MIPQRYELRNDDIMLTSTPASILEQYVALDVSLSVRRTEARHEGMLDKVRAMYHAGEMITICSLSYEEYKSGLRDTVYHKVDGKWLALSPPVSNYRNYSHGFSPMLVARYYPDFWKRYRERQKRKLMHA